MALTRNEIIAIIDAGESVLVADQLYTDAASVPSQPELDALILASKPPDLPKSVRITDWVIAHP